MALRQLALAASERDLAWIYFTGKTINWKEKAALRKESQHHLRPGEESEPQTQPSPVVVGPLAGGSGEQLGAGERLATLEAA